MFKDKNEIKLKKKEKIIRELKYDEVGGFDKQSNRLNRMLYFGFFGSLKMLFLRIKPNNCLSKRDRKLKKLYTIGSKKVEKNFDIIKIIEDLRNIK